MSCFGGKSGQYSITSDVEPPIWKKNGETSFDIPILKYLHDDGTASWHSVTYGYVKNFVGTKEDFKEQLKNLIYECNLPGACPNKLLIAGLYHCGLKRNKSKKGLNYLRLSAETGFPPGIYAYGLALFHSKKNKYDLELILLYLKLAYERGYFCENDYRSYNEDQGRHFFQIKCWIKNSKDIDDPVTKIFKKQITENSGFFGNSKKVAMYKTLMSKWKSELEGYFLKYKQIAQDENMRFYLEETKIRDEKQKIRDEEERKKYQIRQEAEAAAEKAAAEKAERDDPDGSKRREKARAERSKKIEANYLAKEKSAALEAAERNDPDGSKRRAARDRENDAIWAYYSFENRRL